MDLFSFFDDSFSTSARTKILKSNPIKISVNPLPLKGKPEKFSGVVGVFEINSFLDKKSVKVGDGVTLKIELQGQGNISSMKMPDIPEVKDFNVYVSDEGSAEILKHEDKIKGKNIYEVVFIPKAKGAFLIPEIEFNFFNPYKQKYEVIKTDSISINVREGEVKRKDTVIDYTQKGVDITDEKEPQIISRDIRYLKQDLGKFYVEKEGRYNVFIFGFILAFFPIVIMMQLFLKFAGQNVDEREIRRKKAFKFIKQDITKADEFLRKEKSEEFYHQVSAIIRKYLSNKLGIVSSAALMDIEQSLNQKGVGKEQIDEVKELINAADFARFVSKSADKSVMQKELDKLRRVLGSLEKRV